MPNINVQVKLRPPQIPLRYKTRPSGPLIKRGRHSATVYRHRRYAWKLTGFPCNTISTQSYTSPNGTKPYNAPSILWQRLKLHHVTELIKATFRSLGRWSATR